MLFLPFGFISYITQCKTANMSKNVILVSHLYPSH